MNHIYKIIFNKALGVFTAVPEFASAHGKGSERTVVGRVAKGTAGFAASVLAISVGLALTSTSAVAYPGIYVNDRQAGNCLAINDSAIPNVGMGTILDVNSAPGTVQLRVPGTYAPQTGITPSHYNAAGSARPCVAVGGSTVDNRDTQTNRTLFYGGAGGLTEADEINDRNNGAKNLTLGGRLDVNSGIIGVGDRGVNGNDGTNSIRMGWGTSLSDANKQVDAVTIGVNAGASAKHATAIGSATTAKTGYSTALGYQAQAGDPAVTTSSGEYATAIGGKAKALNTHTTALGYAANASGNSSVAIGDTAAANTGSSIAIGTRTVSGDGDFVAGVQGGGQSISIGYESVANIYNTVAIGMRASTRAADSTFPSWDAIAVGVMAAATTYKALAVGAYTQATGGQSTVIGNNQQGKPSTASGYRSQVYGVETTVSGNNSVSIGDTNTIASARTYAMGNNINVKAGADDSLAFGTKAAVGGNNAIAMGNTATASGSGAVAISNQSKAKTTYSIALGDKAVAGDDSAGALNNGEAAIAIGREASANVYNGIALGKQATVKKDSSDGIAIGSQTKVNAYKGTAIGAFSEANGSQALAIGNNKQGQSSVASGERSQVIGVESNVSGQDSTAIGYKNTVASARTYAMGNNINVAAGADDSLAFGTKAAVGAANTVAIGANANAAQANSVALGAGSVTSAPHTGDYTLSNSYTAAGSPVAANGVVSVGSKGKERQIQNVAAGVISTTSTDAINGSQLYATNNYINNFAGDVKTKLGGNAALGNDGHLTMTNIGGTGKDNVNDAIAAANTKVAAGDNITVTSTTGDDGSKTYTVATKKDLVVDSVKAGDTTVNTDGVTIANGPSITKSGGINANGRKVTGVVNGDINPTSTDAVNGSQLHATNTKLDNVANALADTHFVVDTKATTGGELDGTSQADQKIKSGNKVTLQAGKNLKAKQTNGKDGAQVEFSLKDSISLTQVTAGTGNNQVVLGNDGVKVGDSTLNTDGLTIAGGPSVKKDGINAGNKKITGVADGNVAPGSTDAVNGGQLAEVKSKADSAVQNVVSANPTALTVTKAGDTVTLTPNFIAGDLVNPATGEVNTPAADDAGKLVTAGTVAKALAETHFVVDTKATTGGELDGASQANQKIKSSNKVTLQAGKNLKAKQTNGTDGAQVEFSLKDSISLTQVTAGTGDNQVVLGKDGVQVGGNTYINKDGINAAGKAISNVANGNVAAYSKDAVNGGQLHDTAKSMADVIGGGATVKDGKVVAGQNGIGNTGQNTVHGAIAAINQNTANNFNQIRGDLRKMDRDLRGSIAGTLATAGLPQAFSPGKSMVAAAAGTYRGQSGLAVGVSRISDNGKVILKVTGNTNSRGDFGGTIGAGYQW